MARNSLPFGKYRDEPIEEVPIGYLTWLLEQDWPRDDVLDLVRDELCERLGIVGKTVRVETPVTAPKHLRESVDAILVAGFRAASIQAHPDQGGSDERMRGLLAAREWLGKNLR